MSIKVTNITKYYGKEPALKGVSFEGKKSEIIGFLGPNGAGKSTLMKILTTYLKADSGEVLIDGLDPQKQKLEVQKNIGYLPEHNPLYEESYVLEYLNFIAGIHKVNNKRKRIQYSIEQLGLTEHFKKKIKQLSKGYQQRVGLAACLIHNPNNLILDEPTTGLDPNQIIEIRNVIKETAKDKTILLSTHIMQEVEAICDRVILINKGTIIADTSVSEVKKNEQSIEEFFKLSIQDK